MPTVSTLLLSFLLIILSACAENQTVPPLQPQTPPVVQPQQTSPSTQQLLNQVYQEWSGVPHQDGGLSKKGIDCSGFVYVVFKTKLNQKTPRTTRSLVREGSPVSQGQLQPGDLIFFKIRPKVNHVGIYTGDGTFIHASKSKGVYRSKLSLKYWQDHYWQSRRILTH